MNEPKEKLGKIPVPAETHRGIKMQAAQRGVTIGEYVESAMKWLAQGLELQPKEGK